MSYRCIWPCACTFHTSILPLSFPWLSASPPATPAPPLVDLYAAAQTFTCPARPVPLVLVLVQVVENLAGRELCPRALRPEGLRCPLPLDSELLAGPVLWRSWMLSVLPGHLHSYITTHTHTPFFSYNLSSWSQHGRDKLCPVSGSTVTIWALQESGRTRRPALPLPSQRQSPTPRALQTPWKRQVSSRACRHRDTPLPHQGRSLGVPSSVL